MNRILSKSFAIAAVLFCTSLSSLALTPEEQKDLLQTRESVWRTWFAGDTTTLDQLLPPETIVISSGEKEWKHKGEILKSSADFHASNGKLVRLEFPQTEIQSYGDVAVIYSSYLLEIEEAGKHSQSGGRVTEIFVHRNGKWVNSGWHTDAEK